MPTFITHAAVGLSGARIATGQKAPLRFWVLSAVVPALADLDVAAFVLGIPYANPFGHRGFFHSLTFAALLGTAVAFAFFGREGSAGLRRGRLALYFSALAATHGLLDALTNGGLGVALFAPFSSARVFFPVTPIQVSPIGIRGFFSARGAQVMLSELLWVWLPLAALTLAAVWLRRRRSGRGSGEV